MNLNNNNKIAGHEVLEPLSIILENPSETYFPGQTVAGQILLETLVQRKTTGITIKFHGKASVQLNNYEGEGIIYDSETYLDFENYLKGDGRTEFIICPGKYSYKFSYQLPQMNLPSSFEGLYGGVKYSLEATLRGVLNKDHVSKKLINVSSLVDVNRIVSAELPGQWETSKTVGCFPCSSGQLKMIIRIDRKGFTPGESLCFDVEVNNASKRKVKDLSTELVQEAIFYVDKSLRKTSSKCIAHSTRGKGIDAGESETWGAEFIIPPVPPTKLGGCRLIDVEYYLLVKALISGIAFNLKQSCPVFLGTVPLGMKSSGEIIDDSLHCDNPEPTIPEVENQQSKVEDLTPPFEDSYNLSLEPAE